LSADLVRVDDRLLHGQVLLAWAAALAPQCVLLAHDAVAADPARRQMYLSLAEGDYDIEVEPVEAAAAVLAARGHARTLCVVGGAADARRLVELGLAVPSIQLGGLHHREGAKRLLDYIHVTAADAADLLALLGRGVALVAQDLPGSRRVPVDAAALARLWP
jgi:mannose/fructose/N-acetylgalactosamine-specific phosphotransferase system component IIB